MSDRLEEIREFFEGVDSIEHAPITDRAIWLIDEVDKLRVGSNYTGDLYDQARAEFAGDMGWDHDILKEKIKELEAEVTNLKERLKNEENR